MRPGKDTVLLSRAFELDFAAQIINVEIFGNLKNTWLETDIDLMNIESGEEHIALREMSYYTGTDSDGYFWVEGERKDLIRLCGVKKGKYVLAMHLFLANEAGSEVEMEWKVSTDNQMEGLLLWGLFFVGLFFLIALFIEIARWRHSPHTLYFQELTNKDIQKLDDYLLNGHERGKSRIDFFS